VVLERYVCGYFKDAWPTRETAGGGKGYRDKPKGAETRRTPPRYGRMISAAALAETKPQTRNHTGALTRWWKVWKGGRIGWWMEGW